MGGGQKIKLQKKTEFRAQFRAEQGQTKKKSARDATGIEKRILSVHHPSTLVQWWVLVRCGPLVHCPNSTLIILFSEMLKFSNFISFKSKNIVKDNCEYLGVFYLLK